MSTAPAVSIEVPDIGDFDEVPVIEILVSVGDHVDLDDPLLTLESDKATMDVPAPFAGIVRALHVSVGDRVAQGTLLLEIEPSENGAVAGPSTASAIASEGAPSESAAPDSIASALAAESPALEPPAAAQSAPAEPNGNVPVYASPSVRRLARELGVDLASVAGTGRKGRITPADVERLARGESAAGAASTGRAPSPAGLPGLNLAPWPSVNFEKFGPVERVPRSRIQKIAAQNLARNWVMILHVTHNDEADITDLEAWRKQLNEEHAGMASRSRWSRSW